MEIIDQIAQFFDSVMETLGLKVLSEEYPALFAGSLGFVVGIVVFIFTSTIIKIFAVKKVVIEGEGEKSQAENIVTEKKEQTVTKNENENNSPPSNTVPESLTTLKPSLPPLETKNENLNQPPQEPVTVNNNSTPQANSGLPQIDSNINSNTSEQKPPVFESAQESPKLFSNSSQIPNQVTQNSAYTPSSVNALNMKKKNNVSLSQDPIEVPAIQEKKESDSTNISNEQPVPENNSSSELQPLGNTILKGVTSGQQVNVPPSSLATDPKALPPLP